jgi:hypothetical protein
VGGCPQPQEGAPRRCPLSPPPLGMGTACRCLASATGLCRGSAWRHGPLVGPRGLGRGPRGLGSSEGQIPKLGLRRRVSCQGALDETASAKGPWMKRLLPRALGRNGFCHGALHETDSAAGRPRGWRCGPFSCRSPALVAPTTNYHRRAGASSVRLFAAASCSELNQLYSAQAIHTAF